MPVARQPWSPGRTSPTNRGNCRIEPLVVPPFDTTTAVPSLFEDGRWSPGRRRCASPSSAYGNYSLGGYPTSSLLSRFQSGCISPRGNSSVAELMSDKASEAGDSVISVARSGITLTRGGWTSRRSNHERNSSPGVSGILSRGETQRRSIGSFGIGEDASTAGVPSEPPASPRSVGSGLTARRRLQAQNSSAVQSLLRQSLYESAKSAASSVEVVDGSSEIGFRCQSPHSRFQQSDSVRQALSGPVISQAPVQSRPACLTAPFDCDTNGGNDNSLGGFDSKIHRLTEVARSAMEAAALRVNAEKLFLRNMDMTSNFLPGGGGIGKGGSMQPGPTGFAQAAKVQQERRFSVHSGDGAKGRDKVVSGVHTSSTVMAGEQLGGA